MGTILLQARVGKYCTGSIHNGGSRRGQPFHNTKCCMLTYRQPTLLSNGYSRNRVWRTHSTDILAKDYWYWHFMLIHGKMYTPQIYYTFLYISWDLDGKFSNVINSFRGNGIVMIQTINTGRKKDVICVKVYRCILKHVATKRVLMILYNNASGCKQNKWLQVVVFQSGI